MLFAILVAGFSSNVFSHVRQISAQDLQSLLIQRYGNEPLELIDLKIRDQSVKSKVKPKSRIGDVGFDEVSFPETEGWAKHIRVRMKNISEKPLTGFQMYVYLMPSGGRMMFSASLTGTKQLEHTPLSPWEEIEAQVDGDSWDRAVIRLLAYGGELKSVEVRLAVGMVGLPDGLYWNKGSVIRMDPQNPNRYIPVEPKRPFR